MTEKQANRTKGWVDFKRVKAEATFEPILARYSLELKPKGEELVGLCPFHTETKGSFRVNVEKRVFHCFGCGAKGNVLDFVARKEGVGIKRAGELLAEWLGLEATSKVVPPEKDKPAPAPEPTIGPIVDGGSPQGNRPLTFALKLDSAHPYCVERGVNLELGLLFGVGYCSRGMMKGRMAIALHDTEGHLVGYAGRWPGEPPQGEERYKLPAGFKKSEILYNLHRVKGSDELVVVEGCWGVFRLHKEGIPAVALLGRDLSARQEELLRDAGVKRLVLLLDGDAPGREAAAALLPRLARQFSVRIAVLPDGVEPDTASLEILRALFGN